MPTAPAEMPPLLANLMRRIRHDHERHHLKVMYTPTTLRIVDSNSRNRARVSYDAERECLLVGAGDDEDTAHYARPSTVDQALRLVYKKSWKH